MLIALFYRILAFCQAIFCAVLAPFLPPWAVGIDFPGPVHGILTAATDALGVPQATEKRKVALEAILRMKYHIQTCVLPGIQFRILL